MRHKRSSTARYGGLSSKNECRWSWYECSRLWSRFCWWEVIFCVTYLPRAVSYNDASHYGCYTLGKWFGLYLTNPRYLFLGSKSCGVWKEAWADICTEDLQSRALQILSRHEQWRPGQSSKWLYAGFINGCS